MAPTNHTSQNMVIMMETKQILAQVAIFSFAVSFTPAATIQRNPVHNVISHDLPPQMVHPQSEELDKLRGPHLSKKPRVRRGRGIRKTA